MAATPTPASPYGSLQAMSWQFSAFLEAEELDDVADLVMLGGDLDPADKRRIRSIIADQLPLLGRRNLLFYPELIPSYLRGGALLSGLDDADTAIVQAAVVGSHRTASNLESTARRPIVAQLVQLLDPSAPPVTRQRASAALIVLALPGDALHLISHLESNDEVVRHNIRAALVRTLGPKSAHKVVVGAAERGHLNQKAAQFVSDGVCDGRATNDQLIMRGVLAPDLVPLSHTMVRSARYTQ
jgi:hypothetical protein